MGKKKKILLAVCAIILLVLNVLILSRRVAVSGEYRLDLSLQANSQQKIQVYYTPAQDNLSEDDSSNIIYNKTGELQNLSYRIPSYCNWIRIDLGTKPDHFTVSKLEMSVGGRGENLLDYLTEDLLSCNQISNIARTEQGVELQTNGEDPYLWIQIPVNTLYPALEKVCNRNALILNILILLFLDGGAVLGFVFRNKILTLPIELWQSRALILNLAKNDFKTKYAGSYLGIVWAFIQPIVTILVYWFVFSVGMKAGNAADYPFVLYLVSGIVPWFFFQDSLNGGTNALIEYSYLVKKVVFKISILPIVKIVSAFFVHVFFVLFALILCWLYGYAPCMPTIQILYYSACTFMLSLSLVYATSAIVIFFRDLTQIISIVLQVGVWMTPVMWDLNMLSDHPVLMKVFKLNPMYYVVSGYRDSMLGKTWVWEHLGWTLYFWVITAVLLGIGTIVFKRLKPHFADVL